MTDKQHEQYRSELNKPYTDDELGLHLLDRDVKSLLEMTHAHNYQLIKLTTQWIAYTHGRRKRPARNLWKFLTPGVNNDNSACDRLNQIVDFYTSYPYGSAPVLPIAFFCSRSTATLISRLEELHNTPHLDTIERAAKDFFTIITNEIDHDYTPDQLKATLRKSVDDFVKACEANAIELHKYLLAFVTGQKPITPATKEDVKDIVHAEVSPIIINEKKTLATAEDLKKTVQTIEATAKTINNRDKKYRRKTNARFTIEEQDGIYRQWSIAKIDTSVKTYSRHKPDYDAAIIQFRKEFAVFGVKTAKDIKSALRARSERLSRKSKSS